MTNDILCAIDFSDSAKAALRVAVDLAKKLKSRIIILYTYRLLKTAKGEAVQMKRKMEEEAHQRFSGLEKDILAGNGIEYEFKIEVGFMTDRVAAHATKNGVSFLVMDKKIGAGSKEIFDELLSNVHVPLIIVP